MLNSILVIIDFFMSFMIVKNVFNYDFITWTRAFINSTLAFLQFLSHSYNVDQSAFLNDYHLEYRLQSLHITVIIGSLNMHYSDVRRLLGEAAFKVLLLEYRVPNQSSSQQQYTLLME